MEFSGKDRDNRIRSTKQVVYISESCKSVYLSREACEQLGLISRYFPKVGTHTTGRHPLTGGGMSVMHPTEQQQGSSGTTFQMEEECTCPEREEPPPLPKDIPFPAAKENVGKLKKWLIERYSASTFNQCPHKPLPQMTGPPLELAIKPDTKPVAVHKPSPVPMHWKKRLKQDWTGMSA